jgi:hypothetical protein
MDTGRVRAVARVSAGAPMADWTRAVSPWQEFEGRVWLEPPARVRGGLARLREAPRRLLMLRYGWGGPAHTLEEAAAALGTTRLKAALMERRAVREAVHPRELSRRSGGKAPDLRA